MVRYRINRHHTIRVKKLPSKLPSARFVKTIGSGYRVIYRNARPL